MNNLEENSMQIQAQIDYICMSPNCFQSNLKFIGIQDVPKHKQCNGWLVKIQDLQSFLMPTSQNAQKVKKNFFDFKGQPLKSLFDINKYFLGNKNGLQNFNTQKIFKKSLFDNDPIQLLQQQFNQIRLKIEIELEKTYKQVESRILNVQNVQQKTINQIRRILTTVQDNQEVSKQILRSAILKEYQRFCQTTDSFTIIEEGKIKKQLFKISQSISSIGNCFWKTQLQPVKRQKQLFEKTYKQLQNLHSDTSVHPSIKLLSLQKMYQQKAYQTFYSQDKSQVYVKCWVCNNLLFGEGKNIKQRKSVAYENLVNHLTMVHFQETTAKFTVQMIKSSTHQLSYEDFLKLLEDKQYEEFIIVDRQNVNQNLSSIINEKIKQKVFLINVVSSGRQNLAFGKYMVAMSKGKDSADTLMIMIIYAIITSGYYRYVSSNREMKKPKITLFTKDHFADTYQEILKNGFEVELNVIK